MPGDISPDLCPHGLSSSDHGKEAPTVALVTVISTSPLLAAMISPNLAQTPPSKLSLLFSASMARRFRTVLSLAGTPAAFSSSVTIWPLSDWVRVGADRMAVSLASLAKMLLSEAMALAVLSRVEVFTAAVYYTPDC